MLELQHKRRSFLLGMASLGISQTLLQGQTTAQAATSQGYVLGPDGGDHLVHYRNPGNIFIKVDPTKGSPNLALGTQQIPVGAGIPIHRHFEMDEAFYVLEGSGECGLFSCTKCADAGRSFVMNQKDFQSATTSPSKGGVMQAERLGPRLLQGEDKGKGSVEST